MPSSVQSSFHKTCVHNQLQQLVFLMQNDIQYIVENLEPFPKNYHHNHHHLPLFIMVICTVLQSILLGTVSKIFLIIKTNLFQKYTIFRRRFFIIVIGHKFTGYPKPIIWGDILCIIIII